MRPDILVREACSISIFWYRCGRFVAGYVGLVCVLLSVGVSEGSVGCDRLDGGGTERGRISLSRCVSPSC